MGMMVIVVGNCFLMMVVRSSLGKFSTVLTVVGVFAVRILVSGVVNGVIRVRRTYGIGKGMYNVTAGTTMGLDRTAVVTLRSSQDGTNSFRTRRNDGWRYGKLFLA